ncbi:MAG: T9SS type A sorting domain-containing protein [Chitinophagaceae bacterium]|nr:MAG: T9SS type A sorting domain-containing protein [Chitinophagaceae bacterium]
MFLKWMRPLLLPAAFLSFTNARSQNPPLTLAPQGGGSYVPGQVEELSPAQRSAIVQELQANERRLSAEGLLRPLNPQVTAFAWPLRLAAGLTDNGYYGISNYIDQNNILNQVLEYNCGSRTYDGHKGTDIYLWPFPWAKMDEGAVEVIAAAPGTIIGKSNGFDDKSCAMCTACTWNAVYIRHADGSVAWYGHFRNNSVTTKAVGQTVAAGEYLGIVGSSGSSTGPHLHFEVYTSSSYTQLVDPWSGPCNALNGTTSWWNSQQGYRTYTVNAARTHNAPPQFGCYNQEVNNLKTNFEPGELAYFVSYYRDQQPGITTLHTIYRPDNSVWRSWSSSFVSEFNSSYWYWSYTLPTTGLLAGTWRYEVFSAGQTTSTNFTVGVTTAVASLNADVQLVDLAPNPSRGDVQLRLQVRGLRTAHISIVNAAGSTVRRLAPLRVSGHATQTLPTAGLAPGLYFIQVTIDGKTYMQKLTRL